MVWGLPLIEDEHTNCNTCQLGNQSRMPFASATRRASVKLHLVYTDLYWHIGLLLLTEVNILLNSLIVWHKCVGFILSCSTSKYMKCSRNSNFGTKSKLLQDSKCIDQILVHSTHLIDLKSFVKMHKFSIYSLFDIFCNIMVSMKGRTNQ